MFIFAMADNWLLQRQYILGISISRSLKSLAYTYKLLGFIA